jgi:hypothetical protein
MKLDFRQAHMIRLGSTQSLLRDWMNRHLEGCVGGGMKMVSLIAMPDINYGEGFRSELEPIQRVWFERILLLVVVGGRNKEMEVIIDAGR